MPRNGANVYSKAAGTTAITSTAIESAKYNSTIDDLVTDANLARPIVAGGTGATSAAAARTNLAVAPLASPAFTGTPTSAGQFQFANGTAALPGVAFADPDNGMWSPGANLLAFSTAGAEAFRITSAQSLIMGSSAAMTGIGGSRISSQGTTAATGQWALGQFNAGVLGPTFAFGKSRGAAVDTYTIVAAGDALGNVEAWGADGATMILSARLQSYVIGTPALGDVRGGLRLQTGSAAGAIATRLTIDDTTIEATLPISTTAVLTGGFTAHAAAVTAMAFGSQSACSLTPNSTRTLTTTVPPAGTASQLIINTSGVASYTMTFGTGFTTTGTLATGTVTAKTFTVSFISNGTSVIETGRTVAM